MRYRIKVFSEAGERLDTHVCDAFYNNSAELLLAFSRALLDEGISAVIVSKEGFNEPTRQ